MTAPAGNTDLSRRDAGGDRLWLRTCYLLIGMAFIWSSNKVLDRENYNKG